VATLVGMYQISAPDSEGLAPVISAKSGSGRIFSWIPRFDLIWQISVNESKNMLKVIRQRKRKRIGHALRHAEFLQEIFEGRMKGRPTRERKRIQLLDDLADGKDYASLKREAEDRSMWRIRRHYSSGTRALFTTKSSKTGLGFSSSELFDGMIHSHVVGVGGLVVRVSDS